MFFALSKIAALFLRPFTWAVALALGAALARKPRRKWRLAWAAAIVLLLFSNPGLINLLSSIWEAPFRTEAPEGKYAVGIVLTGFIDSNADGPPGIITLQRSGNRLTAALLLYAQGRLGHILITGGNSRLVGSAPAEAQEARMYLLQAGVPDSIILVEPNARNTHENAVFTKKMLDSLRLADTSTLLITSAWHMRRALGCFKAAGLQSVPYGTDFLTYRSRGFSLQRLEPSWEAFMKWELLVKEWIGYLAYSVQGYIKEE